ncbi:uncharacterized protein UBRO_05130 [Ustilago bromivora]|uniref:Uncharacterized protein n=1 Tax=Ustilago bromivora TaxID=307758 RepID=A0A1K0H4Z4_9BASI|nr:uncharacterized protein UBRO_05130 [Ustilago bromivora]SYW83511.1 uncharacterized protein UBRO2_05213 [Ustilago bromivora]
MVAKHKPNLSQSSNSSSENEFGSRASSNGHAQASSSQQPQQQPTMSRWERLRRPSAASSTKRPNFNEANRSYSNHSSTVTSPVTSHFPLQSPLGGPSHDMMRTASDGSYMHILAASATARRAAMESGAAVASDTASVMSFTCSLSKEFDRQRTDVASLNASLPDLPSSVGGMSKAHPYGQSQSLEKKQAWLDTTFNKLSAKYREPKKGANQKGGAPTRPVKPHFLDLSSIICPTPAPVERSGSTEDESETGDRSSSSSSSFNSGPDSSFEAMSGWDNSSADTSLELRTPQNEEDRQLACSAYDFTTPRPSQMQRFASAQSAATSNESGMCLPSPPLISPLMPNFALPTSTASTPSLAPPSFGSGGYGFPSAASPMMHGITLDDIHHKPASLALPTPKSSIKGAGMAPPAGMSQLRKQKSFDNPAELRHRQKQEWSVGGPMPPGYGGNAGLTIGIPKVQHFQQSSQQQGMLSPQQAMSRQNAVHPLDPRRQRAQQMRSPPSNHAPLPAQAAMHSRVAEMQVGSAAMQRGVGHDTASAGARSPPQRPGLVPRASSGALRMLNSAAPTVSDMDPASSTGFSTCSRQQYGARQGTDCRMRMHSPLQSPVGGPVPLPPLLAASSRESYGSSVGSESLPPTPHSATFLRGLPLVSQEGGNQGPSPARDHRMPSHHHAAPMMHGSALGLMPGKMVRAYSDNPATLPLLDEPRLRTGSRLRGESISSNDGGDERDTRPSYSSQTTPRQKIRPELRREHTSNAVLTSPSKSHMLSPISLEERPGSAASATITPRSSSLKDLVAIQSGEDGSGNAGARTSMGSDCSNSSLAYTKPSPLIPQDTTPMGPVVTGNNITPTNSYRTDLVATTATGNGGQSSKCTPDNSPAAKPNRQRANSRADEWAANLRKFTTRGGGNAAALPVGK